MMYRENGFKGFFAGLNGMLMKMIPLTAIAFTVNNYCKIKMGLK